MGIMSTSFIFGPILYLWNLQFSDSRVSVMGYSLERQGSRGSFGFVWFQKSKKEPQSGSCGVGSSAVRFLAVQETVRFYECDSCAT